MHICQFCGTELLETKKKPQINFPVELVCSNCGKKIKVSPDRPFCNNCGNSMKMYLDALIAESEASVQTEKGTRAEQDVQAEPISQADRSAQTEPITQADQSAQTEPITQADQSVQTEPITQADQSAQTEPISQADDSFAEQPDYRQSFEPEPGKRYHGNAAPRPGRNQRHGDKKGLIIVICVLAVGCVAFAGALLYMHLERKQDSHNLEGVASVSEVFDRSDTKQHSKDESTENSKKNEIADSKAESDQKTPTPQETEISEPQVTEQPVDSVLSADYIIPDSGTRVLTESDVAGLTLQEVNYAKNEIYARRGRKFKSNELNEYFSSKSWYHGTIEPDAFTNAMLSSIEIQNSEFLSSVEHRLDPNGYQPK
jgi:hypothetical protein